MIDNHYEFGSAARPVGEKLLSGVRAYEEDQLEYSSDTFRGVNDHSIFRNNGIVLASEIKDKVVGDIGSGYGGLAKTASIERIPSTIYSINPRLKDPAFKRIEEEMGVHALRKRYRDITEAELREAQASHDKRLLTNFAHKLDVADNFFDLFVDTAALNYYANKKDISLYEISLREMLRVLKHGGKILVEDWSKTSIGSKSGNGKLNFKENILINLGLRYTPLYSRLKRPEAAIIYKD